VAATLCPLRTRGLYPTIFVYALVDPTDDAIRYVGRTRNIKGRLTGHLSSPAINNRRKYNWIRKLRRRGLVPRLVVLETCRLLKAPAVEQKWIDAYRPTLFNGTARGLTKLLHKPSNTAGVSWYQ
jgi:hypothetical protein